MNSKIKNPGLIAALLLATCLHARAADEAPLPNVLILGDSIYNEPSRSAAKELAEEVKISYVRPGDTSAFLANFEELLGDTKWDVIHFNFGFADLHYRDPKTKSVRAMSKLAGGVRITSPQRYEQNLRQIVVKLKATDAKLIWASTTPIDSSKLDNLYDPGSEIEYNSIAARIMEEHRIYINDMHSWVRTHIKDKKDPNPFSFNRQPIHPPIVESIFHFL